MHQERWLQSVARCIKCQNIQAFHSEKTDEKRLLGAIAGHLRSAALFELHDGRRVSKA